MDNSKEICFNYALGSILYETCLLGILYLCNISPIVSSQIMLFLKLFTPVILVVSYLFLRVLCRADRKRKKDDFSEVCTYNCYEKLTNIVLHLNTSTLYTQDSFEFLSFKPSSKLFQCVRTQCLLSPCKSPSLAKKEYKLLKSRVVSLFL